jgi:hypothetical protein
MTTPDGVRPFGAFGPSERSAIHLHDTVRVASVGTSSLRRRSRDGRPPELGDIGTVVEIVEGPDVGRRCVVEAVDRHGAVVWLADFDEGELALVDGLA